MKNVVLTMRRDVDPSMKMTNGVATKFSITLKADGIQEFYLHEHLGSVTSVIGLTWEAVLDFRFKAKINIRVEDPQKLLLDYISSQNGRTFGTKLAKYMNLIKTTPKTGRKLYEAPSANDNTKSQPKKKVGDLHLTALDRVV